MNYSFFGSLMTVVMLAVFVGIVLWAYSDGQRAAFDAAARVPLEDDTDGPTHPPSNAPQHEGYSK